MAGKNIKKFFAFRFFSRFYFYFPIIVIFFFKQGLSAFQTGCLISIYSVTVVTFTMMAGNLSDKYGRKIFLIFGECAKAIGLLFLGLSNNIIALFIGQFFCGLGFAVVAGTDSAFLYENYSLLNKEAEYREAEAKSHSVLFFAALFAGIIGAWISNYNIRIPFLLTMPFNLIAAIIALTFNDIQQRHVSKESSTKTFLSKFSKESAVINNVLLYAVVRAVIMTVIIGLLPFYLFNVTNVSLPLFGILLAVYMLSGYICGKYENKLEAKLGIDFFKVIICVVTIISLYLFAEIKSKWGIFIPILLYFVAGSIRPLAIGNINHLLKDKSIRSTTLSFAELLFGILNVLFVLVSFYLLGAYSLKTSFLILLFIFTIFCILIYFFEKSNRTPSRRRTSSIDKRLTNPL